MGFEQIDRRAVELQDASRRAGGAGRSATPLTLLVLLAFTLFVGGIAFWLLIAKGTPPRDPARLAPGATPAVAAPVPAIGVASAGLPALGVRKLRWYMQHTDPTVHALRLAFHGNAAVQAWAWPTWSAPETVTGELAAMDHLVQVDPELRSLAPEVHIYTAAARDVIDGWRTAAHQQAADRDLLVRFAKVMLESRNLREALATLPAAGFAPQSYDAAFATCEQGAAVFAVAPWTPPRVSSGAAEANPDEDLTVPPPVAVLPDGAFDQLAADCLRGIAAAIAAPGARSEDGSRMRGHLLGMANALANEADARARPDQYYVSWAGNYAQDLAYAVGDAPPTR